MVDQDLALSVRNLGKKYRIGEKRASHNTFRDAITNVAMAPLKRLKANGLDNKPNDIWALKDISINVKRGEILGIIGRNGAGKSTLLKILSRITEPTEGEAEIHGRVGSLLEVGTGFHTELSGIENIYLSGAILGMKKVEIENKLDNIIRFSEVEKFLDTPLKHYSSGMQMRLAFSVAAHLEPEILIIDEVLAVGDSDFQKKCIAKMEDVSKAGRTILFVSHNMEAIERLCNRVIQLDGGRITQDLTDPHTAISNYLYGHDKTRQYEWINSGNQLDSYWIKPIRCYLSNEYYKKQGIFTNDNDIFINIDLEIKCTDPGLTIGYAIYDENGHLLYWSYQTDTSKDKWPALTKGLTTITSKLPSRLLNEGIYRIEIIASIHYKEWLLKPGENAPSINLIIQGGLSESPLWMGKRPGILAPVIQWYVKSDS